MTLARDDRGLIEAEIGRPLTTPEARLFENLWSEHCAYRSSRALIREFDSEGERVVIGPGDDAAVVTLTDEWYLTLGIESHNHPSYVEPSDGAATGVGGIVRDTLSMGAYPIALADCLFFGPFDEDETHYLLEGVVDGIANYGNAIGVPTVAGSLQFQEGYRGNPLVNVACVGLVHRDRVLTATATTPGNRLMIVGNPTGRDGLGGASFASEDLAEDAETADRPAVQVGDPYAEKLLIEANEALVDAGIVAAARDLGAAGLAGATSELVAKGELGAVLDLEDLHKREPGMTATELLLAESQERMCYEVAPGDVEAVGRIADRFDLGWADIGEVIADDRYVARFEGQSVVDVPVSLLCEGAPLNDLESTEPPAPVGELPPLELADAVNTLLEDPTCASKEWVYRQYDHEVGVRTVVRPGDGAAVLAIPETGRRIAITAGCEPGWTMRAPNDGARAIALAVATNLAAKGATPIAAVDCINGGNPERSGTYHGIAASVAGLATACRQLGVPVVGGNVSLYNDSMSGPIPPSPTLAMVGELDRLDPPGITVAGDRDLLLVGGHSSALGGSRILSTFGGSDDFPRLPDRFDAVVETIRDIARMDTTTAMHDVSHGGLAVTASEMVHDAGGISLDIDGSVTALFAERPGRVLVETDAPGEIRDRAGDAITVRRVGKTSAVGELQLGTARDSLVLTAAEITERRAILERTLD